MSAYHVHAGRQSTDPRDGRRARAITTTFIGWRTNTRRVIDRRGHQRDEFGRTRAEGQSNEVNTMGMRYLQRGNSGWPRAINGRRAAEERDAKAYFHGTVQYEDQAKDLGRHQDCSHLAHRHHCRHQHSMPALNPHQPTPSRPATRSARSPRSCLATRTPNTAISKPT